MCRNHKHSCTSITDLKRAKSRTNYHSQLLKKDVKNLFKDNYKPLLKEIRKDTNR